MCGPARNTFYCVLISPALGQDGLELDCLSSSPGSTTRAVGPRTRYLLSVGLSLLVCKLEMTIIVHLLRGVVKDFTDQNRRCLENCLECNKPRLCVTRRPQEHRAPFQDGDTESLHDTGSTWGECERKGGRLKDCSARHTGGRVLVLGERQCPGGAGQRAWRAW